MACALTFRRDGASARCARAASVILALPFTLLRKVRIDLPTAGAQAQRDRPAGLRHQRQADDRLRPPRRGATHDANGASMTRPARTRPPGRPRASSPATAGMLTNFTGGRHGVELGQGTPRAAGRCRDRRRSNACSPASPRRAHGRAKRASTGPRIPGRWAATPACVPATGRRLRGAMGEPVGGAAFRRRALRARHPGLHGRRLRVRRNWRRERHARATCRRDFPHSGAPDRPRSPEAFCTRESFFAVQRAIHHNDSFTIATHPDVGEGAGPQPVRPGRAFYFAMRMHGRDDGPRRRIRRTPARTPARHRAHALGAGASNATLLALALASDFAIDTLLRQPTLARCAGRR